MADYTPTSGTVLFNDGETSKTFIVQILDDVLVYRLRDKIDKAFESKLLHTVRGVGYVLKLE